MLFSSTFSFRAAVLAALLLCPASLVTAQDRGREARSVGSFTEIEYGIPGTLHVRQGDAASVEIEAPEAVRAKVETAVEGAVLEINAEGESGFFGRLFGDSDLDSDEIDVYVTVPTLSSLTLAGSGRVVGETPLRGASLSLSVAGSGDMELEVDAEDLSVQVAGSGGCVLRGRAATLDVNVAGSGDLRAAEVETRRTEVRIAGSGDVEVHATDHLSAQIFGSGDVRYRGRPTIDTNTFGSGDVESMEN